MGAEHWVADVQEAGLQVGNNGAGQIDLVRRHAAFYKFFVHVLGGQQQAIDVGEFSAVEAKLAVFVHLMGNNTVPTNERQRMHLEKGGRAGGCER